MATFNGLGVAAFAPVSNVTPFTYRDGETFLSELHRLKCYITDMVAILEKADEDNRDYVNISISNLTSQFNSSINSLTQYFEKLIENSHDETLAFDPTSGVRLNGLSTVVSHIYDNLRIYGLFAKQFDALNMTCVEFENRGWSARHFDIGVTYPVINDVISPDHIDTNIPKAGQ